MAPLIERSEAVADASRVVLIFDCIKRTLQPFLERELPCRFSDLVDDVRAEVCLPLLGSGVGPLAADRQATEPRHLRQHQPVLPASLRLHAVGLDPTDYNRLIAL